ncbi:MAG: hypothetical protein PHE55_03255 [Methylococcaceae bacterium]|nr:hypothetical protein [Methylococcaceae bacterium]
MIESKNYPVDRLETLLAEEFSAEGPDWTAQLERVKSELPEDLRGFMQDLIRERALAEQGEESLAEFAFHCGQAYERLEAYAQSRLAANIAFVGPDGAAAPELDKADLDAIARFVSVRDRILKTVADYTLKFLLVSVILLISGLALGLI